MLSYKLTWYHIEVIWYNTVIWLYYVIIQSYDYDILVICTLHMICANDITLILYDIILFSMTSYKDVWYHITWKSYDITGGTKVPDGWSSSSTWVTPAEVAAGRSTDSEPRLMSALRSRPGLWLGAAWVRAWGPTARAARRRSSAAASGTVSLSEPECPACESNWSLWKKITNRTSPWHKMGGWSRGCDSLGLGGRERPWERSAGTARAWPIHHPWEKTVQGSPKLPRPLSKSCRVNSLPWIWIGRQS